MVRPILSGMGFFAAKLDESWGLEVSNRILPIWNSHQSSVVDQSTKCLLAETNRCLLTQQNAGFTIQMIDSKQWQKLTLSVGSVNQVLEAALRDQCDLLLSEFELLGVLLDSKKQSLRMGELRDLLLITPSGLTRAVDRLVQRKLLRRAAVTLDKRGSSVALLPRGLACYLRAKDVCDQTLRSVLADQLSASQQRALVQALGPLSSVAERPIESESTTSRVRWETLR